MAPLAYVSLHPKLLLFGEYSILMGGQAITVPLKEYVSRFEFIDQALDMETAIKSNNHLLQFSGFLQKEQYFKSFIDIESFSQDIKDGLYLFSNVPFGYGLGSSGLVCASVLKTYSKTKIDIEQDINNLHDLRELFSQMESFFHKKSSGIDPLACYLGKPLYINNNVIQTIPHPYFEEGRWFLLDSDIIRKTEVYVAIFEKLLKNSIYRQELEYHYLPYVNEIISGILHSEMPTKTLMESISLMQLKYFSEMIPPLLLPFWQYGIDTGLCYLKLLGAGGGGYFIGYTDDIEKVRNMSSIYNLKAKLLNI